MSWSRWSHIFLFIVTLPWFTRWTWRRHQCVQKKNNNTYIQCVFFTLVMMWSHFAELKSTLWNHIIKIKNIYLSAWWGTLKLKHISLCSEWVSARFGTVDRCSNKISSSVEGSVDYDKTSGCFWEDIKFWIEKINLHLECYKTERELFLLNTTGFLNILL